VRRLVPLAAALVALALLAAGCDTSKPGEKTVSPLPNGKVTGVKKQRQAAVPAKYKNGNATAGKAVFTSAGCVGCHTLKAAGATGTVGPNLDQAKPPLSLVVTRVTHGAGAMPNFSGQLSTKQIADVAAFVVSSTGGNPNG
jgi:mono/diheme cytochrome c family protein